MKPPKILVLLLLTIALLAILSYTFPNEGIIISDNIQLQFISLNDVFAAKKIKKVDITEIVKSVTISDEEETEIIEPEIIKHLQAKIADSLYTTDYKERESAKPKINATGFSGALQIDSVSRFIEFPNNNRNLLYPFFKSLLSLADSAQLIRIMHYGDSQIESDRITGYLRHKFQTNFGGCGVGLVPAIQVNNNSVSIQQTWSETWTRYAAFGVRDTAVKHNAYGALIAFSRFAPVKNTDNKTVVKSETNEKKEEAFGFGDLNRTSILNSTQSKEEQLPEYYGWINFKKSPKTYKTNKTFYKCRIFYGNNSEKTNIELIDEQGVITSKVLEPTSKLAVFSWNFEESPENLTIQFSGNKSPDIYGIALDDHAGIAVDNIPLRGNSGTEFTRIDIKLLAAMYKELNIKLLILQFGGNTVPSMTEAHLKPYEHSLKAQLNLLKKLLPDVPIILIGLADMSIPQDGNFVTHPMVAAVRDAEKQAALASGCMFWDMYEAMGGENSMAAWVNTNPPLAAADYIHFSPQGAKIVAQMFYNALAYEYNRYLFSVKPKTKKKKNKENDSIEEKIQAPEIPILNTGDSSEFAAEKKNTENNATAK